MRPMGAVNWNFGFDGSDRRAFLISPSFYYGAIKTGSIWEGARSSSDRLKPLI